MHIFYNTLLPFPLGLPTAILGPRTLLSRTYVGLHIKKKQIKFFVQTSKTFFTSYILFIWMQGVNHHQQRENNESHVFIRMIIFIRRIFIKRMWSTNACNPSFEYLIVIIIKVFKNCGNSETVRFYFSPQVLIGKRWFTIEFFPF